MEIEMLLIDVHETHAVAVAKTNALREVAAGGVVVGDARVDVQKVPCIIDGLDGSVGIVFHEVHEQFAGIDSAPRLLGFLETAACKGFQTTVGCDIFQRAAAYLLVVAEERRASSSVADEVDA